MFFDDEFLKSLPEDTSSAIAAICNKYFDTVHNIPMAEARHTFIKEILGFVAAYSEANSLGIDIPTIVGNLKTDENNATQLFNDLNNWSSQQIGQNEFKQFKNIHAARLGKIFHYEFSEGDLKLIQKLINELRDLISTTEELEEDHRDRLIKKLEKVQSELHKRISDLDRFWGFCIDLSIVVGLMGKNAEPAAGLVKKIVAIIWPAQTRAYQLSSNLPFKLLGQSEDDKSEEN